MRRFIADTDADGDGISDVLEQALGMSTNSLDSDGDGLSDAEEAGDDPSAPRDTDGDGIVDAVDTDSDADGLPDSWEASNGLSATNASGADGWNADPDGDGFLNRDEYGADTIPTNAASFLGITNIRNMVDGLLLEWQGGTGAWQYLERRSDLALTTQQWHALFTNVPPTAVATNIIDAGWTNQMLFYRIRAERK